MTSPVGHNGAAGEQLRSVVERVERLDVEIKALNDDKSDIYKEAKANGFDVATIKKIVRLRKQDSAEREEAETLLDLYLNALGMLSPFACARARGGTMRAPAVRQGTPEFDALVNHYVDLLNAAGLPTDPIPPSSSAKAATDKRASMPARPERVLEYQPPRDACYSEMRAAYRAGKPISADRRHQNGIVYFIENPETGRMKVGITNNLDQRLGDLEMASGAKLNVLATRPGKRRDEAAFHKELTAWRVIGEWFDGSPGCRAAIDAILARTAPATHTHERAA